MLRDRREGCRAILAKARALKDEHGFVLAVVEDGTVVEVRRLHDSPNRG